MKRSASPTAKLEGAISPPADKSVSHRAAILNSLASGEAVIDNYSEGQDCRSTLRCLQALGVTAERVAPEDSPTGIPQLKVRSPGLDGLTEPNNVLNAENSGTTMRFIMGLLASTPFVSVVSGDRSLRSRPMARIVQPLRQMGAEVMGRGGDSMAPLTIRGGELHGNGIHDACGERTGEVVTHNCIPLCRRPDDASPAGPIQGPHGANAWSYGGISLRRTG